MLDSERTSSRTYHTTTWNALSEYPQGVIVSNSYREKYGVELGDEIAVKWSKNDFFTATVLAFVDYWPSINPYDKNDEGEYKDFIIMNFDYVRIQTAIEPYQVWLDLKDGRFYSGLLSVYNRRRHYRYDA